MIGGCPAAWNSTSVRGHLLHLDARREGDEGAPGRDRVGDLGLLRIVAQVAAQVEDLPDTRIGDRTVRLAAAPGGAARRSQGRERERGRRRMRSAYQSDTGGSNKRPLWQGSAARVGRGPVPRPGAWRRSRGAGRRPHARAGGELDVRPALVALPATAGRAGGLRGVLFTICAAVMGATWRQTAGR